MKSLIKHFPREIAFPQRLRPVIDTPKEFFSKVNFYNGIKNIYFSLYDCDKFSNFDNCIIDKVVYDFDSGKKSLDKIKSFLPILIDTEYKYSIVFSGNKGFHLYIYTQHTDDIVNRHHVLFNAHMKILDMLRLTTDDVDVKIIGDIKRIIRCPNTIHLKSMLYAIPLSNDDILNLSYKEIREKAKDSNKFFYIYGNKDYSLEGLDYTPKRKDFRQIPTFDYDMDFMIEDEDIKRIVNRFHDCIKLWLFEPKEYCKNNSRWFFVIYCRDIGIPFEITDKIARYFWKDIKDSSGIRTKYQEFGQEKQIYYGRQKLDYLMPSCNTLYQQKFCKGRCSKYKRDGFPIYK